MQRPPPWLLATLFTCILMVHAAALRAQLPTPQASHEDSVRALRTARSRQASFERTRRNNLPSIWGGGGGDCDERIGRFCLTYGDDDEEDWAPPEEPEGTVRARERLLEVLASSAALIPGDGWVAGQRVRYLLEAGRFDAAREAAERCLAAAWWCDALSAFAEHNAGNSEAADTAFTRMLGTMPDDMREEWTDLGKILDTRTARRYRDLPDSARAEFEDRFWTLADPLIGTPGNDLRSEHLSRNILDRLQDRAESTDDLSWGDDLREILVRFGWPSGWERVRPRAPRMLGEGVSLVSHYPDADIDLLPPPELLTEIFDPTAGVWDDEERRPRASYPLPRAGKRLRWFTPFDHQIAVFRRGDSALVVAAYELPADSLDEGARVDASLAVRADPDQDPTLVRRAGAGIRAVLTAGAPQGPVLVSLEALADEEAWAGRARRGIDIPRLVPGVLAASDLLIFDAPGDGLPESRAGAVERMRGSLRVQPGDQIGVYWELYGLELGRPEALEISLRLVDAEVGWLRRLAERAGVVQEVQPIRLIWGETADADATVRRSLALEIPADLRPDDYALELTISAAGREPVVARRTLQVSP